MAASSGFAWTPKTNLYLAEIAIKDALNDSKVDIYDTNDVLIGHYDCNPALITAITAYAGQYRAGASGAAAYPDIVTGRQIIGTSYPGTDAWLDYLWSTTAGSTGGDRAFTAGYMASAAGDLFGSSFINYYAGGASMGGSDAGKQAALQSAVDKQMPATQKYDGSGPLVESDVSIQGDAGQFIYDKMIDAGPGTVLRNLLAGVLVKGSIPAEYSSLKYGLENDTACYNSKVRDLTARAAKAKSDADACGILDLTCSKVFLYAEAGGYAVALAALELTQKPIVMYKEAWIKDIGDGLKAWPAVSHEINMSLHCGTGIQVDRARNAASQFVTGHLLSMAGAPDVLGTTLAFINSVLDDILPPFMQTAITDMKNELLDYMFKINTGTTADQWGAMAANPDPQLDASGVDVADFNTNGLKTTTQSDTINYQKVSAMRNSVTMMKLSLMSRDAVNRLLRDLGDKNDTLTEENIMLGSWFGSLNESRQWASSCRSKRMVLARTDSIFYKIFKRQPGDNDEFCTSGAPLTDSNVVVFNTPMAGKNDMSQSPPVTRRLLRLTMPFDGSLRVDCRGTDAVSQPYITLFEEDSVTSLGTGDEDPTVTYSNMRLEIPALRKGRYIVEVHFYNPASYTLTVSPTRHIGNDIEPNDTARQAIRIGSDTTYTGWIGDIGGYRTDPGDWYKITLSQAAQYNVSMVSDTTMKPKVVLYDQDTVTELATGYSDVAGYTALATPQLTAGTYFLWVTGYGFGSYLLTPSVVVACGTDIEPNNTVGQSMKLKVDSTLTARLGQVGGGVTDNNDWYAVSISAGALSIRFESNPDLSVGLFLLGPDSSTELAAMTEPTQQKVITRSNLGAGTYFVNVQRYAGQGCYHLTATQSAVTALKAKPLQLSAVKPSFRVGSQRISYVFTASRSGPASLMIYDMMGRLKTVFPFGSINCGQFYSGSVGISGLPKGIYCVRLAAGASILARERLLVR
jgi:hypothetical protein